VKRGTILNNLAIEGIVGEGQAITHADGKVVFVEGALPGDVADVVITKDKKDFAVGRIHGINQPSDDRTEPFCQHFGTCGGCKWQHARYDAQARYKENIVADALKRIAGIPEPNILPIIPCAVDRAYRNKLEFTFTDSRWLTSEQFASRETIDRRGVGFHMPGAFDRVLDVQTCWLQQDYNNTVREIARKTAIEQDLTFYNLRRHSGMLRNLIIRNTSRNEWMVTVVFGAADEGAITRYLGALVDRLPAVSSWHYVINQKLNDSIADRHAVHFHGNTYLTEHLNEVQLRIGPKSFFQTNTAQALRLYDVVGQWVIKEDNESILDLYCGIGSIGLLLAPHCQRVTGIEAVAEAIEDARHNARLNGIDNAVFHCQDLDQGDWVGILEQTPDVIVVDPPRSGLHKDVIEALLGINSPVIVYVSCNPATQARDIQMLGERYRMVKSQPVDMFPQTYHVENVALLEAKSN
jgi:23S rRNA (uracil1939-C5)-methyltransferase